MTDVLLVSLGGTLGLRAADAELAASLRRAGASVEVVTARPVREWRTMAAIELAWALSARRAAAAGIERWSPRAVVYSSTTAALLWPRPGAIRFDAPAAGNRPGRHGLWQRPAERRRFAAARLLVPWSAGGLAEAPPAAGEAIVVPVPVEPSGPVDGRRDIAAVTYGSNPGKKGLDRVLAAWTVCSRPGEKLVVAGLTAAEARRDPSLATAAAPAAGNVEFAGRLPASEYRALLRRARVFVTAPRREDYGIAQLEALADGCVLVTAPAPGPYAALGLARSLDPATVGEDLPAALRHGLDRSPYDASTALRPFRREAVDRVVAERLLPALLRALA